MSKDKKDKVVSLKGDLAEELVLNYLKAQNRPYGATDISANLKSRVSKPQAQKTLAALHEKGEILGKAYGKTTVYCALQTESDTLLPEDLAQLEAELTTLKAEEQKLKEELKVFALQKVEATRLPRTEDLAGLITSASTKCEALDASLAPLRLASSTASASAPAPPPAHSPAPHSSLSTPSPSSLTALFTQTHSISLARRKTGLELQAMLLDMFAGMEGAPGRGRESEVWEVVGGEWEWIEGEGRVWKEVREVVEGEKRKGMKGGR